MFGLCVTFDVRANCVYLIDGCFALVLRFSLLLFGCLLFW